MYIRVSTKEQTLGNSLDVQTKDNLKCAEEYGFDSTQVITFDDRGESAKTADRPGLIKLLQYCRENKGRVSHLFIWKIDRLARNIVDYYAIKLQLMTYGVSIAVATEAVSDEPSGKIMEAVLAAVAEINNKINSDRAVANMKRQLENGISPWYLGLGYLRSENKKNGRKKIQPDQPNKEQLTIIARGLNEFSTGVHTVSSLTKRFREWGLITPTGGKVYPQLVDKILTDIKFAGYLVSPWTGETVKGRHQPAITLETYQKNQLIKAGRSVNAKPRSRANPEFPLREFARCYECGETLTGSFSTGNGGKFPYYHCKNRKCLRRGKTIPRKDLHDNFFKLLQKVTPTEVALTLFKEIALDVWETKRQEFNFDAERHEKKIAEIKTQISELITMRGRNLITDEQLLEAKQPLEESKIIAQLALNETHIEEWDIETAISYATQFIRDLPRQWMDYSLENKQRFQQMVFPEGITYDKEKFCRTTKLGLIYELLQGITTPDSNLVPREGFEPSSLAAYAPQTYAYSSSATWALSRHADFLAGFFLGNFS